MCSLSSVRRGPLRSALRSRFVDDAEQLANPHVVAFPVRNPCEHAAAIGIHLEVDLLGLELDERFADLHAVAFLLQPARDARFNDRLTELRHDDVRHKTSDLL